MRESDKQVAGLDAYVEAGDFSTYYGAQYGDPLNPGWPWGQPLLNDYLTPYLGQDKTVLEICAGGGRWSQFIMPACKKSILVDGTAASEAAIRGHFGAIAGGDCEFPLSDQERVQFLVSKTGKMAAVQTKSVDFVWSFDTFVHFDSKLFYQYLREIARVLKPGGTVALYYAWDDTAEKPFFRYYEPAKIEKRMKDLGLIPFGDDLIVMDSRMMTARKKR